jgi:hypothetical protein
MNFISDFFLPIYLRVVWVSMHFLLLSTFGSVVQFEGNLQKILVPYISNWFHITGRTQDEVESTMGQNKHINLTG